MSSTKIDFLYLNEEEMVKAGVTDMHRCVEVMGRSSVLWEEATM